jgi:hypothetical protein
MSLTSCRAAPPRDKPLRPHARIPLGYPQREGRLCAANFDNARSVHEDAKAVLAIPYASKFKADVGDAILQQLMDMHLVQADQLPFHKTKGRPKAAFQFFTTAPPSLAI